MESGDVEAARELALSRIGTLNTQRPLIYERCFADRCRVSVRSVVILTGCGAVTLSGRSAATPLRDQMQSLRQSEALPLRFHTSFPFQALPLLAPCSLPACTGASLRAAWTAAGNGEAAAAAARRASVQRRRRPARQRRALRRHPIRPAPDRRRRRLRQGQPDEVRRRGVPDTPRSSL